MLGTTNARTEREEMELHEQWAGLVTMARGLFRSRDGFDIRAESDTIKVVGTGHDSGTLLKLLGMLSSRIIIRGIETGMPVRGCVAAGKYCTGIEDLVTGETVSEAKKWHDRAEWIGIVTAPSAGAELDRMEEKDGGEPGSVHDYCECGIATQLT